jgi:hypothetical protein
MVAVVCSSQYREASDQTGRGHRRTQEEGKLGFQCSWKGGEDVFSANWVTDGSRLLLQAEPTMQVPMLCLESLSQTSRHGHL